MYVACNLQGRRTSLICHWTWCLEAQCGSVCRATSKRTSWSIGASVVTTSSQQGSFLTLPNALIIQLKRFNYIKCLKLEKVNSPIIVSRQLVLNVESSTSESSASEQTPSCYSLMSIVSHLGSSAYAGHYICDGAHRDEKPQDMSDNTTYNEEDVSEATGTHVCHRRQRTAYLLFYVKHQ
ncbi:ubiquitin carboxyl-terminal hydrolase 37-like [Perca fluviatilis]|uniref:ubiquitin carboxyl-terminal hydrolase 37-like n=1 Tax=Perca fluviatilis TaxID=8168 RepID=UPI0019637C12|nr:ubiquitin carboxyl-terminal hydrolase 37-like [Perca fluviatilis]